MTPVPPLREFLWTAFGVRYVVLIYDEGDYSTVIVADRATETPRYAAAWQHGQLIGGDVPQRMRGPLQRAVRCAP
jgi:hypothetical protein